MTELHHDDVIAFQAIIKQAGASDSEREKVSSNLKPWSMLKEPSDFDSWCKEAGMMSTTVAFGLLVRHSAPSVGLLSRPELNNWVKTTVIKVGDPHGHTLRHGWRGAHQNYFHGATAQAMSDHAWLRVARIIELSDASIPVGAFQSLVRGNWSDSRCRLAPLVYPSKEGLLSAYKGHDYQFKAGSSMTDKEYDALCEGMTFDLHGEVGFAEFARESRATHGA